MIDRRAFLLVGFGGLLVAAQRPAKTPRIGLLTWEGCLSADSAFGQGLRDLGYRWGETLSV